MFLKSSCVLCDNTASRTISLCTPCESDFPLIDHACNKCGLPTQSSNITVCGQCLKNKPVVDYTISLYHFETPVDHLIRELKFQQKLSHAAILGKLLADKLLKDIVLSDYPDVILPVPLHNKRLIERGFNQSFELAKPVSKALNIPIDKSLVSKAKQTASQTKLTIAQRKRNIKDCFQMSAFQKDTMRTYKHVVIIDDVVTTGATTNELARLLKNSGVGTVGVWSIARAVL